MVSQLLLTTNNFSVKANNSSRLVNMLFQNFCVFTALGARETWSTVGGPRSSSSIACCKSSKPRLISNVSADPLYKSLGPLWFVCRPVGVNLDWGLLVRCPPGSIIMHYIHSLWDFILYFRKHGRSMAKLYKKETRNKLSCLVLRTISIFILKIKPPQFRWCHNIPHIL